MKTIRLARCRHGTLYISSTSAVASQGAPPLILMAGAYLAESRVALRRVMARDGLGARTAAPRPAALPGSQRANQCGEARTDSANA